MNIYLQPRIVENAPFFRPLIYARNVRLFGGLSLRCIDSASAETGATHEPVRIRNITFTFNRDAAQPKHATTVYLRKPL